MHTNVLNLLTVTLGNVVLLFTNIVTLLSKFRIGFIYNTNIRIKIKIILFLFVIYQIKPLLYRNNNNNNNTIVPIVRTLA